MVNVVLYVTASTVLYGVHVYADHCTDGSMM